MTTTGRSPEERCENEVNTDSEVDALNLYERFGLAEHFSEQHFIRLWEDARQLYTDYPYHNFAHAVDVFRRAMEWAEFCESQGIKLNRKILAGAALFHDAMYHDEAYEQKGYESKEDHSAALFGMFRSRYGYTLNEKIQTQAVIYSTKLGMVPSSRESLVMVMADIGNVGGDYSADFMMHTERYRQEKIADAIRLGVLFDRASFEDKNFIVLCTYLFNISKSRLGIDTSRFMTPAVHNLQRRASQICDERKIDFITYLLSLKNGDGKTQPAVGYVLLPRIDSECW